MNVQKVLSPHVIAFMQGGRKLARKHFRLLLAFFFSHLEQSNITAQKGQFFFNILNSNIIGKYFNESMYVLGTFTSFQ